MKRLVRTSIPGRPDYRLECYPSAIKVLPVLIVGTSVGIAMGIGLVLYGNPVAVVVGVVVTALFGLVAVRFVTLLTRNPSVVLDCTGIDARTAPGSAGTIPWPQLKCTEIRYGSYYNELGIQVVDNEAILARMNPIARIVARGNVRFGGSPLYISQLVLPLGMSVEHLAEEIERVRSAAVPHSRTVRDRSCR